MPVTFDNAVISINTTTSTCVVGFTVAANACLVAGVSTNTDTTMSAVYANGTPLTLIGRTVHTSNGQALALYGLLNAPSGTVSLSCQTVAAATPVMCMGVGSYIGGGAFGTYAFATASSVANVAMGFSTSTTDRIICFAIGRNTMTAMNLTTRLSDINHLTLYLADTAGPAATYSISWSANAASQNMNLAGVNIVFSVAASVSGSHLSMCGVGD